MFALRLAVVGHLAEPMALSDEADRPALLVSYAYLDKFFKNRRRYRYRDWVLDSGAFSAFAAGTSIPLDAYIDICKRLMSTDVTLSEIYALDVITDWRSTLANTEKLWKAGIPAIPCFHVGEPQHALDTMAAMYPKVALGGVARGHAKQKTRWAEACVARIWPKKVHGFGIGFKDALMKVPFHSVDASTWQQEPTRFGLYKSWGGGRDRIPVRGDWTKLNIRANVNFYLDLEREVNERWAKELAELEAAVPTKTLRQQAAGLS